MIEMIMLVHRVLTFDLRVLIKSSRHGMHRAAWVQPHRVYIYTGVA